MLKESRPLRVLETDKIPGKLGQEGAPVTGIAAWRANYQEHIQTEFLRVAAQQLREAQRKFKESEK